VRHLPNLICLFRIALVWPIVVALQAGDHGRALAIFVLASVSDGLDGFLAKRFGWTSALGRFLDPLADKLLLVAVFIVGAWSGLLPWWLTAAVVARDVCIGLGALVFRLWFGFLDGRPTTISKVNTLLQILVVSFALLAAATGVLPTEIVAALAVAAFVTTCVSGFDYVSRFLRRAWHLPPSAAA
jgi:cardiolipin synthase